MISRKLIGLAFIPWLLLAGVIVAGVAMFLVAEPEPEPPDCILLAEPIPEPGPEPPAPTLDSTAGRSAHLGEGVWIHYSAEELPMSGKRMCGQHASPDAYFTSHYTMRKLDGGVFDKSKPDKPFTATRAQVIQGYAKALSNMCVGDSATVFIPKEQAYGDAPNRGGDVIFDIDLLQIADQR